jgi:hypothetical protein
MFKSVGKKLINVYFTIIKNKNVSVAKKIPE